MLQQQKKQIYVIYCIILILAATVFGIGDIESSRMERGLEQNKSVLREVRTTSINEIGILPTGSVLRTVFETQSLNHFNQRKQLICGSWFYHFCLPYPGSFVIPENGG